jgi:hypothetical protein
MGTRTKSSKMQVVDVRNHLLVVNDGADRVGSLVERAGEFHAHDLAGRHLGSYPTMVQAARAIPTHFGTTGTPAHPQVGRRHD